MVVGGGVVGVAEERMRCKYAALGGVHQFEPIAVETMGVYGTFTGLILRAIGRRLVEATGEAAWFYQNLGRPYRGATLLAFYQPIGRVFRGSGDSRIHSTPHFVPEGIFASWKILFRLVYLLLII